VGDDLLAIARELVRGEFLDRVHIGLDFFDASINRVAAWTIGMRAMAKALLVALLEPVERMRDAENTGDLTARLAMVEAANELPYGAVWDHYCESEGVPPGLGWLDEVRQYEQQVTNQRR
jgi:L-rhamnose isomerase